MTDFRFDAQASSNTILHIDSSVLGEHSHSRRLSRQLAEGLSRVSGLGYQYRDLDATPLPVLSSALLARWSQAPQGEDALLANQVLNEFLTAKALVIAAPMYNFSVPASLKTWMDYICRAGVTFRYGPSGPEGLVVNKPVYIVSTRGGQHLGSDRDHVTGLITTLFGFLGVQDLRWLYAEGLSVSALQSAALTGAEAKIAEHLEAGL